MREWVLNRFHWVFSCLVIIPLFVMTWWVMVMPVEAGKGVGEDSAYARQVGLESRFFYVASGSDGENQVEYICQCFPGTTGCGDTATAVWQVVRFSYDASDRNSRIEYAGGDDAFVSICDNRVSLTY